MLSPQKQKEAEVIFNCVRRLCDRHGKDHFFEIGDRLRLKIIPNFTKECTTITVVSINTSETVMIGAWDNDHRDFPPSFIAYRPGFWKSIITHHADQLYQPRKRA